MFVKSIKNANHGYDFKVIPIAGEVVLKDRMLPKYVKDRLCAMSLILQKMMPFPLALTGYALNNKGVMMASFSFDAKHGNMIFSGNTDPQPFEELVVSFENCKDEEDMARVQYQLHINEMVKLSKEIDLFIEEHYLGFLEPEEGQLSINFEEFSNSLYEQADQEEALVLSKGKILSIEELTTEVAAAIEDFEGEVKGERASKKKKKGEALPF